MRNFKQVAAMTLAGVMTVSMAGVQTPAATNTTFSKAVSMMDVSNATGSGNVGIDIAGDEVSEEINWILYSVYREAHRNDDDTKGEDGRTAYKAAWDAHSQKLGLLESYDEKENTYKYTDRFAINAKISTEIVTTTQFSVELAGNIANGKEMKLTKIEYNNGNLKIDLDSFVKFMSEYCAMTTSEVYEAFEIPALKSIELDSVAEINNMLQDRYGRYYPVIGVEVVEQKDIDNGYYNQDELGKVIDVKYGEEAKEANFALTGEQVVNTVMNLAKLVLNTADSAFAKFETTNGTKTAFKVTDEQASEFVLAIADALSSNSKTIVDLVFGQLKVLPGFDEMLTMPVEAEKYISDNMIESLNNFAQDIKDIATTVTITDEDNNEIKVNPLQEELKKEGIKFDVTVNSDLTGEKGYRDYKVDGSFNYLCPAENDGESLEKKPDSVIAVKFDFNLKENGQPPAENPANNQVPANNDGKNNVTNNNANNTTNNDLKSTLIIVKGKKYKVTSAANSKNPTVTFLGNVNKKVKNVKVPASITYNNVNYKVTAIAPNAFKNNKNIRSVVVGKNVRVIGKNSFKGCKNLKTLVIKGKKLKKIKKGAFKNANSKIVIKCAKGQGKKYRKLVRKSR